MVRENRIGNEMKMKSAIADLSSVVLCCCCCCLSAPVAVCGGCACSESEMLSGGSPGGPVQVTVLPLALLAQPHPRLLGLHAVGDALLVHVLRQANVGDAGRILAQ